MTTAIATDTLQERSQKAAGLFLDDHGYNVIENDWNLHGNTGCIAEHEDTLVFIQILSRESDDGKLPEELPAKKSRPSFEQAAAKYLMKANRPSMQVRFDIISLLFIGKNQALLRHHKDALSSI